MIHNLLLSVNDIARRQSAPITLLHMSYKQLFELSSTAKFGMGQLSEAQVNLAAVLNRSAKVVYIDPPAWGRLAPGGSDPAASQLLGMLVELTNVALTADGVVLIFCHWEQINVYKQVSQ